MSTVKEPVMLISEVAAKAGVSRDAVRLYTRLGLVTCTSRQAGSRLYADYDDSAVELIKGIKIAQSIGFTLSELAPIAAPTSPAPSMMPSSVSSSPPS
ncbi:MAG TPA: MerR family transcriptional regulator [Trebonia sp.]|nr:MerR family transcriptional regulator [Trebonia sp.]